MIEINGDIFDFLNDDETDSICITTNGIVNFNGLAMMGAGTAGYAAKLWPSVRSNLGKAIKANGNLPHVIGIIDKQNNFQNPSSKLIKENNFKCLIWSFPTKQDFRYPAIPSLIKNSAEILVDYTNKLNLKKIIIPAPGIGLNTGKLDYNTQVKPLIQDIFDNRFFIVFKNDH